MKEGMKDKKIKGGWKVYEEVMEEETKDEHEAASEEGIGERVRKGVKVGGTGD